MNSSSNDPRADQHSEEPDSSDRGTGMGEPCVQEDNTTNYVVSDDDGCPICLGVFIDKAKTNSCTHYFCFGCIGRWAETKPECPVCKQRFSSILYDIKSDEDFREFELPENLDSSRNPDARLVELLRRIHEVLE